MAKLYIAELQQLDVESRGRDVMVGKFPAVTTQVVDFTAGETDSNAFNGKTKFVRLWSDTDCFIEFGDAPTAVTATSTPMTAQVAEYFGVISGQRVSVIS